MSDWKELVDPKSGKTYYANYKLKKTTWRMPPELKKLKEKMKALESAPPPPPPPSHKPAPPGPPGPPPVDPKEIKRLEAKVRELKRSVEEEQKKNQLLELNVNMMREELIQTEEKLAESRNSRESVNDALQKDLDAQRTKTHAAEAQVKEEKQKAILLESQIQQFQLQNEQLKKQVSYLKENEGESEQLRKQIKALEASKAKADKKAELLSIDLEQLQSEVMREKAGKAKSEAEAEKLTATVREQEQKIRALETNVNAASSKESEAIESLKKQLTEMETSFQKAQRELDQMKSEKQVALSKIEAYQAQVEAANAKLQAMQAKAEVAKIKRATPSLGGKNMFDLPPPLDLPPPDDAPPESENESPPPSPPAASESMLKAAEPAVPATKQKIVEPVPEASESDSDNEVDTSKPVRQLSKLEQHIARKESEKDSEPELSVSLSETSDAPKARSEGDWNIIPDPSTGKEYYHNTKTGETTWDKPVALGGLPPCEWKEISDPASGRYYYHNIKTNATTWDKPHEFIAWEKAKEAAKKKNRPVFRKGVSTALFSPPPSFEETESTETKTKSGSLASISENDNKTANSNKTRHKRTKSHAEVKTIIVHLPEDEEHHDLPAEHLVSHTFEKYANDFFQQHKRMFSKATVAEMASFNKKPLSSSLQNMQDSSLEKEAVQTFRNITSFMGDRKSSKPQFGHVEKLSKIGLNNADEMRNEIFCQIVKQVRSNPSRESMINGWKLMAVLLGIFAPGKQFMPYFKAFLRQTQSSDSDSEVARFARYCEDRLYQTLKKDARKFPPLIDEVEASMNRKTINIRVYFEDGTSKTLACTSQTTVENMSQAVCRDLGLTWEGAAGYPMWGMYQVDGHGASRTENPLQSNIRILDARFMYFNRVGFPDGETDVEMRLLFKAKLLFEKIYKDLKPGNMLDLIYVQGMNEIVRSKLSCSNKDAIVLAALEIQAVFGPVRVDIDDILSDRFTQKFVPKSVINQYQLDMKALRKAVAEEREKVKELTKDEAKLKYLAFIQAIPMYGCNFFPAERQLARTTEECVIGVSERGVYVLHPVTKQQITRQLKMEEIIAFKQNPPDTFEYSTGPVDKPTVYKFKTRYRTLLANRMNAYLSVVKSK